MNIQYGLAAVVVVLLIVALWYYRSYSVATASMKIQTDQVNILLGKLKTLENVNKVLLNDKYRLNSELVKKNKELQAQIKIVEELEKTLGIKSTELAQARATMFNADDYIINHYVGDSQETLLLLRRIRDLVLEIAVNGQTYICKLPQWTELLVNLRNMIDSWQSMPELRPIDWTRDFSTSMYYSMMDNCSRDRSNIKDGLIRELVTDQGINWDNENVVKLAEALETVITAILDKHCINGRLNVNAVRLTYDKFTTMLCQPDTNELGLLSKPLDLFLAKYVNMFI